MRKLSWLAANKETDKMTIHKRRLPIYNLDFFFGTNEDEMKRKFGPFNDEYSELGGWVFVDTEKLNIVMWLPEDNGSLSIPHLVHECLHAAMGVAKISGLNPTPDNNESVAYLAQWFSETVLDFIHSKKQEANE